MRGLVLHVVVCCCGGAVALLVDYLLVGATACAAWRAAQEEEARAERAARLEGDARTAQLLDELAQVRTGACCCTAGAVISVAAVAAQRSKRECSAHLGVLRVPRASTQSTPCLALRIPHVEYPEYAT